MTEVGTLKEIGAKVGDVVEYKVGDKWIRGIISDNMAAIMDDIRYGTQRVDESIHPWLRIISRATPEPKLWRDMTPEEKGALLMAHHEGKVIERMKGHPVTKWVEIKEPGWQDFITYRVKPEPKVETVTQYWKTNAKGEFVTMAKEHHNTATHAVTFNLIDGKPDCASVKMEKL